MNECWNFFKYAKLDDLESINQLIVKNSKWFSHLNIDHFRKKIIRKWEEKKSTEEFKKMYTNVQLVTCPSLQSIHI